MVGHSLEDVLKRIKDWEARLEDSYFLLKEFVESGRSKQTILILKRQQEKILLALAQFNVQSYKKIDHIKILPPENLVPDYEITANTCPRDIFEKFLVCEIKLEEYYKYLRDAFGASKARDLFEVLLQFKLTQVREIKDYLDSYALVS